METGFLLDLSHGARLVASWISGPPQKGRWFRSVKIKGKTSYQAEVWRCEDCGYLESYAKQRVQPSG
jgi:hypothetical protein